MTTIAEQLLKELGFSEYEARAYLTLLQEGSHTGYQLAKSSGIPRPNIYAVLARLEQRGAVSKSEAKGAARYSALPAGQMIQNAERSLGGQLARTREALEAIEQGQPDTQVWNIEGYEAIIERARGIISEASRELLLAVGPEEAARLGEAVADATARGVAVTTLCMEGCREECGGCAGNLYRYSLEGAVNRRSLVIVRDGEDLLVAQCFADGTARGAATRMNAFVDVSTQFIHNTIAVAEIARSLGTDLPGLLDRRARESIQKAGFKPESRSWLARLISSARPAR